LYAIPSLSHGKAVKLGRNTTHEYLVMPRFEDAVKQLSRNRMTGDDALLGKALSDADDAVLNLFMPDYSVTSRGQVVMTKDAQSRFEQMCARFGVPLDVSNSPEHYVLHAYKCFILTLGTYVAWRLEYSETKFRRLLQCDAENCWPTDWVDYVEAVALNDAVKAAALAKKLRPLDRDTVYPPGTFPYPYPEVRAAD
jgi:hypothetical protein